MDSQFQRSQGKGKFAYLGINVKNPPDLMPQGRAPYMLNVSPNAQLGTIRARAGMWNLSSVAEYPAHSIKRVNNNMPGSLYPWQRFIGASFGLYSGQTAITKIDAGYSGNPLSLVPYRPPQSPETWLYVYDALRQRKFRTNGDQYNLGILPPRTPPVATLALPQSRVVLDVTSAAGWTDTGAAAAPTLVARIPAGMTIAGMIYDVGTTGWASIQPTVATGNYSPLGVGARLTLSSGSELVTIQQMFPPLSPTTVNNVAYDDTVGLNGPCTLVLVLRGMQNIQRNALMIVNGNYTRVESVTRGQDGSYSIRCSLPAGIAAGQAVTFPVSFRAYTTGTHGGGETITSTALNVLMTLATGQSAIGAAIVPVATYGTQDLSKTPGNRAFTDDDYMHVSVWIDNSALVQELHICLGTDSTNNDFAHNYLLYVVRQNDFQSVMNSSSTTVASQLAALQSGMAGEFASGDDAQLSTGADQDYPNDALGGATLVPLTQQMSTGLGQWFELVFKLSALTKVGNDQTVGLWSVKALSIAAIITGTCNIQFGSWWITGVFGPDCNINSYGNQGQPIIYRYRYRSSLTGAVSDVSPATRSGEIPWRQAITVSVTASQDAQVDLIDLERNGGTGDTWHWVQSFPNLTQPNNDLTNESVAQAMTPLELLQYTPWPITDRVRRGTCDVVGTRITWTSGDQFNLNWIRGVEILIGNNTYTLYAPPDSATSLQITETITGGVLAGATFIIPEATIIGQTLPYAALGPDGRIFACGDQYNPGFLYYSNPYNPDTASDRGYIEVTSPSEPLIGAPVFFEGSLYVFSTESVYRVDATPGSANPYAPFKLGHVNGLAAPWATSSEGPFLAWLGVDGIYTVSAGGQVENITNADIGPLFPFESRPGFAINVNGFSLAPPDYTQQASLRLSFADDILYFNYIDTLGSQRTLTYNVSTKGWIPHTYAPAITHHYQEEGVTNPLTLMLGVDGTINYVNDYTQDFGGAFPCIVLTPADDQGDTRAMKLYGDVMFDYRGTPNVAVYSLNYLTLITATALRPLDARAPVILDLGNDIQATNIAVAIGWNSDKNVVLYEWQPSFVGKPETTYLRATDWTSAGTPNYKFIRGVRITANTFGQARTVQIQYDGSLLGPVLTVIHNGEQTIPYTFQPFKAHAIRLVPTDSAYWELINVEWEFDPEPEPVSYWVTQSTAFGFSGYAHIRDMYICYVSATPGASVYATVDGVLYTLAASLPASPTPTRLYFPAPAVKGKLWQIYGTGAAIQVYKNETEFRMKEWAGERYSPIHPLGQETNQKGANI